MRRELERLAKQPARSGREALAKASALRQLQRLNRKRQEIPAMPENWHPGPPEFEELDEWYLEQHPEVRERWWVNWWLRHR